MRPHSSEGRGEKSGTSNLAGTYLGRRTNAAQYTTRLLAQRWRELCVDSVNVTALHEAFRQNGGISALIRKRADQRTNHDSWRQLARSMQRCFEVCLAPFLLSVEICRAASMWYPLRFVWWLRLDICWDSSRNIGATSVEVCRRFVALKW